MSVSDTFGLIMTARKAIIATGKQSGFVECPKCGGKLRFAVAKSNGHVHAQCETQSCIGWIE